MIIHLCVCVPAFAQTDDNPFLLKRGDNEWGFWAGGSPKATTIFGGLHDDEAEDRKFFIAALRYGRTLAANDSLALQYTLDVVPVAVATGTIVSRTTTPAGHNFSTRNCLRRGIHAAGFATRFRKRQQGASLCSRQRRLSLFQ